MVKSHNKKKTKAGKHPVTGGPKKAAARKFVPHRTSRGIPMSGGAERQCAKHYANTVMNPFDTPSGACVPVLPCLDSAKRKIFSRGIGQVNSNGFGGVNCTTALCSDISTVQYTDGTGGGTTMGSANTATALNNSELLATAFSDNTVQARVVGCGLRVRYVGKQIDMNGSVYALEEPSHLSTDALTVVQARGFDKVKSKPFNREWVVASWQPVLPAETAYSMNPYASPYAPASHTPLVILIQCQGMPSGTTLPFEWEWFLHYEAIGSGARGKSSSHMAPIAGPMVMAALQKAPSSMYDDVSNGRIHSDTITERIFERGTSFLQGLGERALNTGVGVVTSRAAAQYMSGGLAALAL